MPAPKTEGPRLSLNALRAFVMAARESSFRRAAESLHVTASALSHQIRALETQLQTQLFTREPQGLRLTDTGQRLFRELDPAFGQIERALRQIMRSRQANVLTVSMLSTFAMRWFIPRLYRFRDAHPEIEIRISTSIELVDFDAEDIDCAIRSGHGHWPGSQSLRLFSERLTAVCAPKLLGGDKPLQKPEDLAAHTLLHAKLRPEDWRIWLKAAGLEALKPAREQTFETRNFVIAAAIRGLGVAVMDPALVEEEIRDGRLVQPFPKTLAADRAYYFVWPENRPESEALDALRRWLVVEARAMGV